MQDTGSAGEREALAGAEWEDCRVQGVDGQPGCITSWEELAPEARRFIADGGAVRAFHACFSGRAVPRFTWRESFAEHQVESFFRSHPFMAPFCDAVLARLEMKLGPEIAVLPEEVEQLRASFSTAVEPGPGDGRSEPFELLVSADLGRLESAGQGHRFTFRDDAIAGYLLFRSCRGANPSLAPDDLKRLLHRHQSRHAGEPRDAWDSIQDVGVVHVTMQLVREGRARDLLAMSRVATTAVCEATKAVWLDLQRAHRLPPAPGATALASSPAGAFVEALFQPTDEGAHLDHLVERTLLGGLARAARTVEDPAWFEFIQEKLLYHDAVLFASRPRLLCDVARGFADLGTQVARGGDLDRANRLIGRGLALYEDMPADHETPDFSWVYLQLAETRRAAGNAAEARPLLEKGLGLIEAGLAEGHDGPQWNFVVGSLSLAALLAAAGEWGAVQTTLRRTRELLTDLVRQGQSKYEDKLASACCRLGKACLELGHPEEALRHMGEAVDIRERRAASGPPEERMALASVLSDLGPVYETLNDVPRMVDAYRRCRVLMEEVLESEMDRPSAAPIRTRTDYGLACYRLGEALLRQREVGNAAEALRRAVHVLGELVDAGHADVEGWLAAALASLGEACEREQDFPAVLQYCTRARDLFERLPLSDGTRYFLAQVNARLGNAHSLSDMPALAAQSFARALDELRPMVEQGNDWAETHAQRICEGLAGLYELLGVPAAATEARAEGKRIRERRFLEGRAVRPTDLVH